jgi:hypothetical protein
MVVVEEAVGAGAGGGWDVRRDRVGAGGRRRGREGGREGGRGLHLEEGLLGEGRKVLPDPQEGREPFQNLA